MSACIGNELQSSNQTTVIRVKIIHLFNSIKAGIITVEQCIVNNMQIVLVLVVVVVVVV